MPDASTFGMWCGPLSRTLLDRSNGRDGSISTELSYPHRVRSAPDSDRTADIADWQLRANKRLMHRRKQHPYSITRGRLYFVQVAALPAPRAPCWGFSVGHLVGDLGEQF